MKKLNSQPAKALHYSRRASDAAIRRQVSRARSKQPAKEYAPGHFTAPVRAWAQMQWRPGYWPQRAAEWQQVQMPMAPTLNQGRPSAHMTAEREKRAREGLGWGSASLALPGTPSWRANALEWVNRGMGVSPMR